MAGVTPLDNRNAKRVPTSSQPAEKSDALRAMQERHNELEDQARDRLRALVEEGHRFEVTDDGRHVEVDVVVSTAAWFENPAWRPAHRCNA
jgi:hypothetical protein